MSKCAFALSVVVVASAFFGDAVVAGEPPPYQVVDGHKVDPATLGGWRTWRALACERCHGAQQEGLVGPSLIESLKVLSKQDFDQVVLNGRPEKGMPNFSASRMVNDNLVGLYAYLKGRSDGEIQPGHLEALSKDGLSARK